MSVPSSLVNLELQAPKCFGVKHIAVIMDGNRRWAKQRGLPSIEGHRIGVEALKKTVELASKYGVKYLTAYAFSTENWKRSQAELDFLFSLLAQVAVRELESLIKQNVRVTYIGDLSAFTNLQVKSSLEKLAEATKDNNGLNLQIALNYGSINEINRALQSIRKNLNDQQIENLNLEEFAQYLDSKNISDPELVIRTGGQTRLSNYLLWQTAKANLYFTDTLWPDFSETELLRILENYNSESNSRLANKI